ncbi:MAG TPA: ABC transporter permease [Verrucomicrobiae bacterium]|jgi:ABC-type dipeptide/oligopeptide/nickel transport system permease subunit
MSDRVENSKAAAQSVLQTEPPAFAPQPKSQEHLSPNQRAWRRFRTNTPAIISLVFVTLLVLSVLGWPWLSPYDPDRGSDAQFAAPSAQHYFGTDVHGRDLLSRVFYGARISLLVGVVGAGVAFVIGVTWGAVSGYVGGRTDNLMMRFVDVLYALPSVIFVIVLITTLDDVVKQWGSPEIHLRSLKKPADLAQILRDESQLSSAAKAIRAKLTPETLQALSAWMPGKKAPDELLKVLAGNLNDLVQGVSLYEPAAFSGVPLGAEAQRLIAQPKLSGEQIQRLNRLLLEKTFPRHIKRSQTWVTKLLAPFVTAHTRLIFLFVGLGAVSWLTMSRIVRGQVLTLRHRQFVDASRSLGASHVRILASHILPNVYGIVIVYLTLTVPAIILYESFLSYLGLGIQPPMASWGSLIAEGAQQLNPIRIYWWLLVFPASMLVVTLLALNFVGDGLRDAFDPRGKS